MVENNKVIQQNTIKLVGLCKKYAVDNLAMFSRLKI